MDFASFKPCYNQKFFWIEGNLIAFEFGEDRCGSVASNEIVTFIRARYVLYGIDSNCARTGTSTCIVGPVVSLEEGKRLFDLADETGAAEWLREWEKREQMTDPYGLTKFGQDIKRKVLSQLWYSRRWWRAMKPSNPRNK